MESSKRSIFSLNYVNHALFVWLIRGEIILFTLLFKNRKYKMFLCLLLVSCVIMDVSIELTTSLGHGKNPLLIWVHRREIRYMYGIIELAVEVDME